jgi:3-(3-hydroxy-phenyl)propionate hydroxylase/flavoprotein hydroxylase
MAQHTLESNTVDVAVVGYGPVGMVTAALLARAGHTVTVVERYEGLYNLPRAAIFDDETMRTFARLGIADRLLPKLHVQRTYEWRNGAGELLIEHEFAEVGRSGWAEWYMMYQPDLETALDDVCRATGVQVRLGRAVTDVSQSPQAVELTTVDGGFLRARYVVACDGGNSFIRQALGIGQEDYGFAEPWMVCDFRFRRPGVNPGVPHAVQVGDPLSPTSIISLGPDHHRFSFMLDAEEDFCTEQDPDRVWARVAGRLSPDDAELIRVATYTFRSLIAERWRVGRVLLAGDAAHQMPPFLGQGMCSGIRDAQNLAFKLDRVLRGDWSDAVLDTYKSEREPHVSAVIEKGIELGRMQTVRDPVKAAERDRDMLARRATAEAPEAIRFRGLGDGLFAADDPARGILSLQGVVEHGGRRGLLDQIVGDGFHLLIDGTAKGVDAPALAQAGVTVVVLGPDVHDIGGTYSRWFAELGVRALAVRPDLYVFGASTDPAALAQELLDTLRPQNSALAER